MRNASIAVALLAFGLVTPYGLAHHDPEHDGQDVIVVDQATIDCLRSLGPECFIEVPETSGEIGIELFHAPDCNIVPGSIYAGGRDVTGDGHDDTPTVTVNENVDVTCGEEQQGEGGLDSHCSAWIHVHGTWGSGGYRGATLAHVHHNGNWGCHAAGGYWWYSGACGSAAGYSHDTWRITFCDGRYHDVCINARLQNGEYTGWYCWRQYN